ncbi:MAG TPA: biotin--[acetyl-CoA-carboxylase] ligase [Candidatus Binatia bacterium]|nr:biotin--[acetyl-CoA-carboxylase] ligase [Candidatus Binatia bacterium]
MARTLGDRELRALLARLADGRRHSGATLAREARVTRAALAKRIQKLETLGVEVEARFGLGYRLAQAIELLEPDLIVGALPAPVRARLAVEVAFGTDSTNRRLLESGGDEPRALLAEHQTAGRGRRGRAWHSPLGQNLYLSLAWTFAQWPPQLTALPLAVGIATAQALQQLGLAGVKLKWPNDLVVGGHKLGGILIEQRGEAAGACRAVIGLGLNVTMAAAPGITQPWTSLAQAMAPASAPSRNALAARILAHWVEMLDRFASDGFAPFASAWQALDATLGRTVTVHADPPYEGIARGVDASGALQVECTGGQRRVLAGDVSLRVAP